MSTTILYVYALTNERRDGPNLARVSFTSDPKETLEWANGCDPYSSFSYAALIETPNARSVVMAVRNRLRRHHKSGQWFGVSGAHATRLLQETISQKAQA